ncbi:hypothetical protein C1646_767056 [Rhizophagus diaphanus]|nr:hypothetical protein C1646_767056 [Rhizophagus diaphanus] [Rhizophagus sp. MUCL 43196]
MRTNEGHIVAVHRDQKHYKQKKKRHYATADDEFFTNDFTGNIPNDSDDEDDDFYSYNISGSALTLNVGLSYHTWKVAFQHINNGLINKVFWFVKED